MLAIEFKFLAGRFHATPWGRQVNEGAVEWPPSPWRLLRSLIAVWHLKCPDVPEAEVRELVQALSTLPHYRLPDALMGHTRHFMPAENDNRTKIFDAFVVVAPQEPVIAVWHQVTLSETKQALLSRLLTSLQFLGRAESWVDAKITKANPESCNATPLEDEETSPADDRELVRLLATQDEEAYQTWRAGTWEKQIERKLSAKRQKQLAKGIPADKVKLTKAEAGRIESNLPETVFEALHADTSQLRSAGWSAPPASRWVNYVRSRHAFAAKPSHRSPPNPSRPTIARYAVCGKVRPRLTEALWIGESARHALMGCSKRSRPDENAAPVFSGKTPDGASRDGQHRHAHFLPESVGTGQISHLNVFAPEGYDETDCLALSRLKRLRGPRGDNLQLVLIGIGCPEDFGGLNDVAGQTKLMAESRVWRSRTPFIPTRHLKIKRSERHDPDVRANATIRELIRIVQLELKRREAFEGIADHVEIEPLLRPEVCGTNLGGTLTSWLKFRRERSRGNGRHAGGIGYGFRLTFPHPVSGPIALGYGCHFGLGQFEAETNPV